MAKVIFEFNLETEIEEIRDFVDGDKWKFSILELDQRLRDTTKYETSVLDDTKKATKTEIEVAEKYRELIRDILERYNLSL